MHPLDIIIIVLYLLGLLYVGCWLLRKGTVEDFLVNNRKTRCFLLIFTIISSNVGMGTFLGLSSSAYETGISYGLSGFIAVFIGWIVVACFAPKIKKFGDDYKAHTFGDFFGVRYSKQNRLLVSIVILISYFFFTALQFVGIAGLIHVLTGIDLKVIMFASSLVAISYATVAGLRSNFYTDIIHFWTLVIVLFLILLPISFYKAGGVEILSTLPARYYNPFAFAGPQFFFGAIIFGIPVLLLSMEVWQRIYASSTEKEARKVFLLSAVINVIFLIPPVILGLLAIKIVPHTKPDFALFELMKMVLPPGFFGLGIAGVLSAAMATVNSIILVGSITILKDIHKSFINPNMTDEKMLKWGRIYTFAFGFLGLAAAYLVPHIVRLQIIGFVTLMVFAPATIGGFLWKKSTAKGSFWSILIGLIVTFAFYPFFPKTSFIPGTIVSTILFITISLYQTGDCRPQTVDHRL